MIINYLIKALCEKDSVFVNNLGLFRKEYESAQIKKGMITPPGYKLVYDPEFDGNGFAFTMFVSQKGGLLITEATTQIDQWVMQLKNALDHNKSVSFENFGTFAKNEQGVISFLCDRIAELNVEYEGMEPIELGKEESEENDDRELVNDIKDFQEDTKETEEDTIEKDNVEKELEDEENEEDEGDEGDEKGKKKKGWIIWVIILLLLASLAAAAYYFREQLTGLYQQYFGSKGTEQVVEEPIQDITPVATGTIDTDNASDSLILEEDTIYEVTNPESIEEKAISENPVTSQLPDGEKFFIDYEKGKYYVIVGSFRSEKEVRQHIESRKLEQYNPKVVLQPNSKNMRICIGVFGTEAEADSYGRSTGLNYWVLK